MITPICILHLVLQSPAVRQESAQSQQRSLVAMEETMREKIRELQEQRAAAMMTEIVELQKERDLALGKVKRLENKVQGNQLRFMHAGCSTINERMIHCRSRG